MIIDLHSDLLSYLTHKPGRSPDDPISRSSYPQLKEGRVKLQTLAIASTTESNSVDLGRAQVEHFLKLIKEHPLCFSSCRLPFDEKSSHVHIIPAFENASAFANETEPFSDCIKRLENYLKLLGPALYISLTWDGENRFGGGNRTMVGLKEDGKRLLEWISGKRIALDFSHTCDRFAHDMIHFIDQQNLDIPIMASHSNFRPVSEYPRNLPDDLAKEIIRRKGIIGLNFFAPFIHRTDPSALLRHVEYGLSLGAENALSFGADFFCDADFPLIIEKYKNQAAFFPEYGNSSVYPSILDLLAQKLRLKEEQLQKIASQNAERFIKEKIL